MNATTITLDDYDPLGIDASRTLEGKGYFVFPGAAWHALRLEEEGGQYFRTRDFIGMYRRELERKAQGLRPSMVAFIGGRRLRERE